MASKMASPRRDVKFAAPTRPRAAHARPVVEEDNYRCNKMCQVLTIGTRSVVLKGLEGADERDPAGDPTI